MLQPEHFFMKVRLKDLSLKIRMIKNKDLLRKDYAIEDVTNDERRLQRQKQRNGTCYYSGKVINSVDSRVALSTCDGLVSLFRLPSFERGRKTTVVLCDNIAIDCDGVRSLMGVWP